MAPPPTPKDVASLALTTRGGVAVPGSAEYSRLLEFTHNASFHSNQPALFVVCNDAQDVVEGVQFATKHELPLSIRSGGHGACGSSVRDGSVVLDLHNLNECSYSPDSEEVTVGPGATLGDINVVLMRCGRMTSVGVAPPTGAGGLVLHGGVGSLQHKFGTSADNITSLDIVLASGEVKHLDYASEGEDKELFFAARGSAGAVGVVTRFTMRTYPMEMLTGGLVLLADDAELTKARRLMKLFRDTTEREENENQRQTFGAILSACFPPAPDIPKELHGTPAVIAFVGTWGTDEEAASRVGQFIDGDIIVGEPFAPIPYGIYNQLFRVMFLGFPKLGNYFAGKFADRGTLTDEGIDTLCDAWRDVPMQVRGAGFTGLEVHGGAAGAKHGREIQNGNDHSVAHIRDIQYFVPLLLYFEESPENAALARQESLKLRAKCSMIKSTAGGYSNYRSAPEGAQMKAEVQKSDITNIDRIQAIKAIVDPKNVFTRNTVVVQK